MIEFEQFEYERKPQLKARERHHMEALGATLNSYVPNRTRAEHYQENKDHIKQYQENNAEHIKQQQNQKHDCQCGGKYTTTHKQRHLKTEQHFWYQWGKEQYRE